MSFDEHLKTGKVAESAIAQWLMSRGFAVLPVYEKTEQEYKGPQLFTCSGSFVAPDMMAMKPDSKVVFIEAKCKSGMTWSRMYQRFETGIDYKHYLDYQAVKANTGLDVWIMFLQRGEPVKDAPADKPSSPSGLFGNEIGILMQRESHRHDNWGKGGMVYWSHEYPRKTPALRKIAEYSDITKCV